MFQALRRFDWWLLGIVLAILGASLLNLYGISKIQLFNKQLIFIGIGLVLVFVFASFDFKILKQSSLLVLIFYFFVVVLLIGALKAPQVRGIRAWLFLGSIGLEPSELAKLAVILLLTKFFSTRYLGIYNLRTIAFSFGYAALPVGLILLQPDFGSAAVLLILWIGSILEFGFRPKNLTFVVGMIVIMAFLVWGLGLAPYQKLRIINFISPSQDIQGSGFQNMQSRIAVGSGGLWGQGFKNASQVNLGYLSEPSTDFAFAAFAQQAGFLGSILLVIVYGLFFWRVWSISLASGNEFGHHFVFLYFLFVFTHFTINIGMNLGLLPVTGIPLSFFSYGGSHLLTLMAGLGIVESIKMKSQSK